MVTTRSHHLLELLDLTYQAEALSLYYVTFLPAVYSTADVYQTISRGTISRL